MCCAIATFAGPLCRDEGREQADVRQAWLSSQRDAVCACRGMKPTGVVVSKDRIIIAKDGIKRESCFR